MVVVLGLGGGNVSEAGEEGFERRVAIDEGGEEVRGVVDVGAESEEDQGEEYECVEVCCEDCGCVFQDLCGGAEVNWRWWWTVVVHGGYWLSGWWWN